MKNLAAMMKSASQMQQKMADMQAELESATVEGQAGAGLVRITLSGKGEMKSIKIDPKIIDPADAAMLADLIMAAHADAKRKAEAVAAEAMQEAAGGMQLPEGFKLPF
ncbi:MAG: YbaB/EbfC family nucleoid-associated protein [Acetobacteraceae bacterium]|nr:YbaB/EbfC family nucleoid-associated protein [Acetobacteraceae bacterium]